MKRRIVQWLRDLYVKIATKQYGGQPITLYIEPLDGSEPEDVFTGVLAGVHIKPEGDRANFELVLHGPRHEGTGYQEIVRINVKDIQWNRKQRRWQAKMPSKPRGVPSSESTGPRASSRARFSLSTMGSFSTTEKRH